MLKVARSNKAALLVLVSLAVSLNLSLPAQSQRVHSLTKEIAPEVSKDTAEERKKLEKGEVVVGLKDVGSTKYVMGKIVIDQSPDKVWPIMVNPFEFRGRISPRVKNVEVMTDQSHLSVLRMTMDTNPLPLLPQLSYTVESRYEQDEQGGRIEFRRVAGTLKDFRGCWEMSPTCGGTKTELTYSMYLDPGFFVPQWIVREGVKSELPRTLLALRKRIKAVYEEKARPESHNILAANISAHHSVH
ncbi:MAG: SRPBCC family protein [Candidatus Obscuribacterales bacterium]|nr:SRPBCC family protein [Candidatus Obscuribacterales bacterium]